jgi:radical SAM protein with 4Fe4S-binding SPASM domain
MFCHVAEREFSDLSASIDSALIERHVPYMGALELTYRCNQACCHCYCNLGVNSGRRQDEMAPAEIFRILDEAADAGCFWLLLTGGEVLVREDFWEIYSHAIRRGMLVQVFTNATLIDEAAAARFAEFPPLGIDISIYGSCPSVHDRISRVDGSFEKMMRGIEWLKKYGVTFSLKTMLMTLNYADLENIRSLSRDIGAAFRYDTLLSPRIDGSALPVRYRLSADVMAGMDIRDDYESCKRVFNGFWNKKPDEALTCGAGVFAFNINPYGVLSPCTMFKSFQYPLAGVPFESAWKALVRDYNDRRGGLIAAECRSCSMLLICPNCPAWAEIEAGTMNMKVGYICEYGRSLEKKYFQTKEGAGYEKKVLSKTRDQRSETDDRRHAYGRVQIGTGFQGERQGR